LRESIFATSINSAIRSSSRPRLECLQQIGFDRDDALFARDHRVFEGFDLCANNSLSRKFLGCRLTGIDEVLSRIKSRRSILSLPLTS